VIYLGSCALVKLLLPEPESRALARFLRENAAQRHITSAIALTEVPRAIAESGAGFELLADTEELLAELDQLNLDDQVLRAAGRLPGTRLGSLDAVHLASAMDLGAALTAFVSYGERLSAAAQALGLPVSAPGAE
jgi:predicted nucleic acid-binding protein